MEETVEILLIDDDLAEAGKIREMLAESGRQKFSVHHVRRLADGLGMLRSRAFDVILAALALPDSHGLETALSVRNQAKTTPIIVMTVPDDEESVLNVLQSDIQDYLIKGRITGDILQRSIRYAIQLKRDMEKCQRCEQWFASFMLHLPAAVWAKDLQGRYVYANEGDERIFSMPFSEYSGKRDDEFLPPETASQLRKNDEQVLAEGVSLQTVEFLRQADGIEHHYMVNKFPIPGSDGQAAYVAGIALEITERKRAEEELRFSEARFRILYDDNPAMIFILDAEGRIISSNPACTTHLGYAAGELAGQPVLKIFYEDERPVMAERLQICLRNPDRVYHWQSCKISKNGELVWVEELARVIYEMDGTPNVVVVCQDVTERKRTEEALLKSEKKFAKVFHEAPAFLAVTTLKEGKFIDVNNTMLRSLGYRREEMIGRTGLELNIWDDIADRDAIVQVLEEKGSAKNIEARFRGKNGQTFVGLFSAEYIDIEGERFMLSLVKDITVKKQAQEQIERLNTELEEANRELETFSYTVAHDLRKPLTTINGYCQIIRDLCGDNLDADCKEYLHEAYESTIRMNRLIDALLNFSKATLSEPRREQVDISAIARGVADELKHADPDCPGMFRITDGISVSGDPALLRVVLSNLLSNAWKYAGHRDGALIEFGETENQGERACFVRDNGPGFAMEEAGQLFIPFRRLPGAENKAGFGIGLATVERIVHRHGGRVWAESEPGKGATFYFTLA